MIMQCFLVTVHSSCFLYSTIYKNNSILPAASNSNSYHEVSPLHSGDCFNDFVYDPQYYTNTHFNMQNYFEHLYAYSPSNVFGTCSFVSLIQVMSYYDTFYNDLIIDDVFDRYSNSVTTLNQAYQIAPGVEQDLWSFPSSFANLTEEEVSVAKKEFFYNHTLDTLDTSYHSYLIYLYNMLCGNNSYLTFKSAIYSTDYQMLFDYLYGLNQTVVFTYGNMTQQQYINFIKSSIDYDDPVIVYILDNSNPDSINRHAVVAYDYDDEYIYANYGWDCIHTHVPLLSYGYSAIYQVTTLYFDFLGHYHSNNYKISNATYCGCNPNNLSCKYE